MFCDDIRCGDNADVRVKFNYGYRCQIYEWCFDHAEFHISNPYLFPTYGSVKTEVIDEN